MPQYFNYSSANVTSLNPFPAIGFTMCFGIIDLNLSSNPLATFSKDSVSSRGDIIQESILSDGGVIFLDRKNKKSALLYDFER